MENLCGSCCGGIVVCADECRDLISVGSETWCFFFRMAGWPSVVLMIGEMRFFLFYHLAGG